jgi:hypothetical protein
MAVADIAAALPPVVLEGIVPARQESRKSMYPVLVGGHRSIQGGDGLAGTSLVDLAAVAAAVAVAVDTAL